MHIKVAMLFACLTAGAVVSAWFWFSQKDGAQMSGALQRVPTFTIPKGAIGFRYDTTLFRLAKARENLLSENGTPPCDEGFEYCIYRSRDGYASTSFSTAGIRINERSNLVYSGTCLTTPPAGYAAIAAKSRAGDAYEVSVFAPLTGAVAGYMSSGALYRLFTNKHCYEFEARIVETQLDSYQNITIKRLTSLDREIIYGELVDILSTTSIKDSLVPVTYPSIDTVF